MHRVCFHGGVCVRTVRNFYCDCPEQYIGTHCECKMTQIVLPEISNIYLNNPWL